MQSSSSIGHLVTRTVLQAFDRRIESTSASVDRRLAGLDARAADLSLTRRPRVITPPTHVVVVAGDPSF